MKRGTAMKRTAPMKRGAGFKSKAPPPRPVRTLETYTPRARPMAVPAPEAANAATFRSAPKDNPLQHRQYMAAVRKLACVRCGWFLAGGIQFAHADVNHGAGSKGMALKSDCRLGYPACGPHDGLPGCHFDIGTGAAMRKADRHDFEAHAGARTRATIRTAGLWPPTLPAWPGDMNTTTKETP